MITGFFLLQLNGSPLIRATESAVTTEILERLESRPTTVVVREYLSMTNQNIKFNSVVVEAAIIHMNISHFYFFRFASIFSIQTNFIK